jgi:hypothetical protein
MMRTQILRAALLAAALFYVEGALSFVGACHGAGVPVPSRWPF